MINSMQELRLIINAGFFLNRQSRGLFLWVSAFFLLSFSVEAKIYERTQLMYGDVEVRIALAGHLSKKEAAILISQGFEIMRHMEDVFSSFKKDSLIEKLNHKMQKPGVYNIPEELRLALELALKLRDVTKGAFDPTFEMQKTCRNCFSILKNGKILVKKPVRLNLMGLAKGYAVDAAFDFLRMNKKVTHIEVAGSGDIRVWDTKKTVRVGIKNPTSNNKQDGFFQEIQDGAISTSGFYERGRHIRNTTLFHHENLQVTVLAPRCVISDVLAKSFMFQNSETTSKILQSIPFSRVMIVSKNGAVEWFGY